MGRIERLRARRKQLRALAVERALSGLPTHCAGCSRILKERYTEAYRGDFGQIPAQGFCSSRCANEHYRKLNYLIYAKR